MAAKTPASNAQRRKIFVLAKERGLNKEMLDGFIYAATSKNSIRDITISEAVHIINRLEGNESTAPNMISSQQKKYILGLSKQVGFTNEDGVLDMKKLNLWLERRFKTSNVDWLTKRAAAQAIEGLKQMQTRKEEQIA